MSQASEREEPAGDGTRVSSEFLLRLLDDRQRVEGIISLCVLDEKIERLLRSVMIDAKEVDELMSDGRALSPFSMKVRLAYALGLIPEAVRIDLMYINKIRNELAHNQETELFNGGRIPNWCASLSAANVDYVNRPGAINLYRLAVLRTFTFLSREVKEKANTKDQREKELNSLQSRYEEMGEGI